ncbi:MAG: biotin/lipoyl attachment protein [Myxococcales bacterium]|nr:biotin/lipoyl attachment protein [Myxococcales bacterium]
MTEGDGSGAPGAERGRASLARGNPGGVSSLTALVSGSEVRAPAPGWFHRLVEHDHLVMPGDLIGELDVLGRVSPVRAPKIQGLVKLADRAVRRAVSYGDLLFTVDADVALRGAPSELADSSRATTGLVFRAPTSGRFYGRSTPDKPPFVQVGSELSTGTTVCLLEVMKTFHRVTYGGADVPATARVLEVLVADGADVNAGDPLLALAVT